MKRAIIISIISYIIFLTGVGVSVYFLGECNHSLTFVEYQAETCTQNGSVEYWECILCNKRFSERTAQNEITETVIPSAGHKLSKTDYRAETCTEDGNIEYWECSACNKKYSDGNAETEITEVVIPAGHKLSKTEYSAETCTEDGNIEYWQCSECNKKYSDGDAETEITETVIPAAHKYGDFVYDYDGKQYVRKCGECRNDDFQEAGSGDFPLLARDETELKSVVDAAEEGAFIRLANDIISTAKNYEYVLRIPENGTLDLGGYTVTVKFNSGFVVEGTNVTLQNGRVITDFGNPNEGYALFIGDEGDDNSATLRNIETDGGLNVYNCQVVLYDCDVKAIGRDYYALWADQHSTITVNSGEYWGGGACIHSTAYSDPDSCGNVVINGGIFHGKIVATYCTTINGGQFDSTDEVVLTAYSPSGSTVYYDAKLVVSKEIVGKLNIVLNNETKYEMIITEDGNGNFVYETKLKEENND